jgi:outer membrane immunogenic protein
MKRLILAGAAVAALAAATPATAADAPLPRKAPPPVAAPLFNWSGFYIGGSLGAAWGDASWLYTVVGTVPTPNPVDMDGWLGGIHIGAQRQFGNIVIGVEVNYLGVDVDGTSACPNAAFNCIVRWRDLWTIGPRLGFAANNFLFYATVAYANGSIRTSTPLVATGIPFDVSSARHDGWAGGLGAEFALWPNLVFGVEWLHVELSAKQHLGVPFVATEVRRITPSFDLIRARLSWLFGGP